MKRFNQTGSHIVIIAILVVVAGVVGFASYTIAQRNSKPTAETTTSATDSSTSAIENNQDLEATGKSLDSSSGDLDSSVDASSLDSDLNQLL